MEDTMRSCSGNGILGKEPEQSGFFMQSGQVSLGILRDEPDREDVLSVRELLTSADNFARLLIFNNKNALPIKTNWLYLLIT
jgi:hypothetical protein